MANYSLMPWVTQKFTDAQGNPLAGGRIFTYYSGTSTKLATAADSAGSVAQSNPIVLGADGAPASPIYFNLLAYKVLICSPGSDDPPAAGSILKTIDPADGVPVLDNDLDVTGQAGETLTTGNVVYLADGSGGTTAGRWYKADADTAAQSTLPACVGITLTSAAAAGAITVRRGGRVTGLTGLTAGSTYYVSATAGALTSTAPANTRRVGVADSTTTLVMAPEIEEPLVGFIDIPLASFREIAANVIPVTASDAGVLSSNTTPIFNRINGATDKGLCIQWAAGNSDEITAGFTYPHDLDDANAITINILAASAGATNSPTMQIDYFEGRGDTNAGGATAAITGTTITRYTRTIAAADVGAAPTFASISLTPAAHATDALNLYAVYVTYVKKLRST